MQRLLAAIMYPFTAPMDFEGQATSERIFQWLIAIPTAIGFVHGYIAQDFQMTVYWWAAASALAALLVIPVWPFTSSHNIKWLPVLEDEDEEEEHEEDAHPAAASEAVGSGRKPGAAGKGGAGKR